MSAEHDDELEASTTRWMFAGVALTVLFALMFPLYRFYEPAGRADARVELEAALAAQGELLFASTCASCHGADGQGVDAPALNSQQFLESADDAQIASLIAHGIPGTEMSAYSIAFGGPLTSQQIKAITVYIRAWEPDAPDRPDWRTAGEGGAGHDEGVDDGDGDGDHDEGVDDGDGDGDHDEAEDGDEDDDGHDEEEPEHDE
jgi:mono/diheme cytochrome c family protein